MRNFLRPLLVSSFSLLLLVGHSGAVFARGGGGCLAAGTIVRTPAAAIPIEKLKAGDLVLGAYGGALRSIPLSDVLKVRAEDIYELVACGSLLRATAEHPVATGPGVFRQVSVLTAKDTVLCAHGDRIEPEAVKSLRHVGIARDVYNLLVAGEGPIWPTASWYIIRVVFYLIPVSGAITALRPRFPGYRQETGCLHLITTARSSLLRYAMS